MGENLSFPWMSVYYPWPTQLALSPNTALELLNRLNWLNKSRKENIMWTQQNMKAYYDSRTAKPDFGEGQKD